MRHDAGCPLHYSYQDEALKIINLKECFTGDWLAGDHRCPIVTGAHL